MSYTELNKFKRKVESINKSIARLEEKKDAQLEKKNKAVAEREALLIAEALNGVEADEKKLERLRKEVAACDEEIEELDGRIALIQQNRAEQLAPDLPALEKGKQRELERLQREADAQFQDAQKLMFEYLLALQKCGKTRQEGLSLFQDFLHHAKMVDPEKYGQTHYNRGDHVIKVPTLFYDDAGIKRGIDRNDQSQALNGYVEPMVTAYELTGAITSDKASACEVIRKAAK